MPPPGGEVIGFVDVPGHERFVHNMLAGASGIDFALLVVAADDGVMPQTREHLAILDLLGVARGVVALTKIDAADPDRIARGAERHRQRPPRHRPRRRRRSWRSPPLTGERASSALRDHLLRAALGTAAHAATALPPRRRPLLHAAGLRHGRHRHASSPAGRPGDRLLASPGREARGARPRPARAEPQGRARWRAAGRCALNLAGEGVSKDALHRGDMILAPALHAPTDRIDAEPARPRHRGAPVGQWLPVHLHHGSAEVTARVSSCSATRSRPAARDYVQLVLDRPIAALAGDRFVVRDTSAQRTVGGGRFLDLRPPARRRRTPERIAQLDGPARSPIPPPPSRPSSRARPGRSTRPPSPATTASRLTSSTSTVSSASAPSRSPAPPPTG